MAVIVRDAVAADLPAIAALTRTAYAEYAAVMAPAAWAGLERAVNAALAATQPVARMVAELDGRLAGSVMLFPPAADAYQGATSHAAWPELRLLAVAPEARGHGIGRALVEACVERARTMGATEIGLHTSRSMQVAMKLYTGLGFVRAPAYDFQPDGAELVEAYRLPVGKREPASP